MTIAGWVRAAGGTAVALSVHPEYTHAALGIEAVPFTDLAAIVETMTTADLFVLGGGGLFQDYDGLDTAALDHFPALNASLYAQYFHLASGLGLPTVALAQGLGPLRRREAQAAAAEVFRVADHVSLRDADSASLLRAIGVMRAAPVAPDPAWIALEGLPVVNLRERFPELAGKRILGVNLRHWPFDAQWEESFVAAFRDTLPPDWGCLWIDFQRTPAADGSGFIDDEIAPRMLERLGTQNLHVLWDGETVAESAGALAACDAVLAMRLHGVLIGHGAERPVVALEYDGKIRALGDELGVPRTQRMALAEIAACLGRGVGAVTNAGAKPFILPRNQRAKLALDALKHRQILWDAMTIARGIDVVRKREMPPLLRDWLFEKPSAAPRVLAALGQPRARQDLGVAPDRCP